MTGEYKENSVNIKSQKYIAIKLNELKAEFFDCYKKIDKSINQTVENLCHDFLEKPIYEIEQFQTRVVNVLKHFEQKTGITPSLDNLSKMTLQNFKNLLNDNYIKGLGTLRLREIVSSLNKYGFNFKHD